MSSSVSFRVNMGEFTRTLQRYREFSKRDPATIVNTKAFYIARRAVIETPRTPTRAINRFIGWRTGEVVGRIINARRGRRGEKGLYGDAMRLAVGLVKAARMRSRAFLASGWISAIKTLEPLAEKRGAPRKDSRPKQVGVAKGYGVAARSDSWVARAILANLVQAKWDKGGAHNKGEAALQRAFDAETVSMKDYIERKLKESAAKAGVRTK